jgi:hypothetical protein
MRSVRMMRFLALSIAAMALVVFVGGCGGDTGTPSDLAAQDKAVQLGNQLQAMHRRVAQAQRLVTKQRKRAARLAALQRRPQATAKPRIQVIRTAGFSLDSLCGPAKPRGNSDAARRLRNQHERARRQALYNLNLSCPPTRS